MTTLAWCAHHEGAAMVEPSEPEHAHGATFHTVSRAAVVAVEGNSGHNSMEPVEAQQLEECGNPSSG